MREYATDIAPLYNRLEPTDWPMIQTMASIFTDTAPGDSGLVGRYEGLPEIVWALYAERMAKVPGRELVGKLKGLGRIGQLSTIGKRKIHKTGEYGRTALPSAIQSSISEIFRSVAEALPEASAPLFIFNYGIVVSWCNAAELETAMAQAVPMPCAITVKRIGGKK